MIRIVLIDFRDIPKIVETLSGNDTLSYTTAEKVVKSVVERREQFQSYVDSLYLDGMKSSTLAMYKEPTDTNIETALGELLKYSKATSIDLFCEECGENLEKLAKEYNLDFLKGKRLGVPGQGLTVYTIYLPQSEDAQKLQDELDCFIKANAQKSDMQEKKE